MSKRDQKPKSGDTEFSRFDTLFRNVVSVSNKVVREKMKAEKQKRRTRRKRTTK